MMDRKALNYALLKDKAARLGVRLKKDKGGDFLSWFNAMFQPESDENLCRPKPGFISRSVNYLLDPNNDNGFSYDGRPQLSDPIPTSNPISIVKVPIKKTGSKDQLSLRLEMLDKELLEIRKQILEGESETEEDDSESEELLVPVPIRSDTKEPRSLRGLWSNVYDSTVSTINEVESLYIVIRLFFFTYALLAVVYVSKE
jgi:hypothetical protein